MNQNNLQDRLFAFIRDKLTPEETIADAISELLHVSTDSAYRRIRGETPLVFDELVTICNEYSVSIDQLIDSKKDLVLFRNTRIQKDRYSYSQYLQDLERQIDYLKENENAELIYMSKDLPLFYNFYFKPLIAFRYYFWMKIQHQHPDFEHARFNLDILPEQIEQLSRKIIKNYSEIRSTEIWNMESINSTISQIEYSRSSGHFENSKDVLMIYDALESTIKHLQEQAENGSKYLPDENPIVFPRNLKFFFNRVMLGDNTIMTHVNGVKTAFINYNNLNYLSTTDESFCNELSDHFENIRKRSTLISMTSERQRNVFFNILLSKIMERKQNLV